MKIIMKFLWLSLKEKKARTLLVIFSIAAAAALIFANEGFKSTMIHMFHEADTRNAGNSDIRITTKNDADARQWIDTRLLNQYQNDVVYSYSFIQANALYVPDIERMYNFKMFGVNMEEFQQHNPFALKAGSYKEWNGNKVIMGEVYAEKYGLSVGDNISLEINGSPYDFKIQGIAKQEGVYLRELADGGILFVPKEFLKKVSDYKTNLIYIKVKDMQNLKSIYNSMSKTFSDYDVNYTVDNNLIKAETSNYVLPFQISSIAVIFMSIFIIFTGFGLIINERISSLGTLRSVGLTRKRLKWILILESMTVGGAGGFAGCGLGIIILSIIKNTYFKNNGTFTTDIPIVFGWKQFAAAVFAAVIITTLSAVFSISKISNLEIKEIILHKQEQRILKKSDKWWLGVILIIACVIIPEYLKPNLAGMIISCLLATGALIGLLILIPVIVDITAKITKSLGLPQMICLGVRNVKDHSVLMNNLRLFSAMIAIVAYMVSIFNTMSYDLHYAWKYCNLYDVQFNLKESNYESLNRLKAVDGVSNAIEFYADFDSTFEDSNTFINTLYGIEGRSFFDINVAKGLDQAEKAIDTLDDGKYMITTNIMKSKLGLKIGDSIKIRCGDKVETYTITGFVDTNLGIGHIVYISANNYRKLTGVMNCDNFMVQGDVAQDVLKLNIKREFTKDILSINTKQELEKANADKVDSIFKAVSIYTYLAVAISMLGIMNNILAGFLARKRSLALYRCVGMSKKDIGRMMFTEAITSGVIGSTLGLITAFVMMTTIPKTIEMIWGQVAPKPAIVEIFVLYFAGMATMLLVSSLPIIKNSNISILESMKYE